MTSARSHYLSLNGRQKWLTRLLQSPASYKHIHAVLRPSSTCPCTFCFTLFILLYLVHPCFTLYILLYLVHPALPCSSCFTLYILALPCSSCFTSYILVYFPLPGSQVLLMIRRCLPASLGSARGPYASPMLCQNPLSNHNYRPQGVPVSQQNPRTRPVGLATKVSPLCAAVVHVIERKHKVHLGPAVVHV
jgi:hypothetical protein